MPCEFDSGATAWLLCATTFVMLQTPATGMAQAGLVRRKNALSLLVQSIVGVAIGSVMWVVIGFTMTFGPSHGGLIGSGKYAFLIDVPLDDCGPWSDTIPALLFVAFQMMFALMVPVLITGAWAEKMPFPSVCMFMVLWPLFVYYPLAHWVWNGEGWLYKEGVLDFAGGITIHTSSGVSALVVSRVLQTRRKHKQLATSHNIPLTIIGGALVWAGWYSFNAGSALAANEQASSALIATQIAACTSAFTWCVLAWVSDGYLPASTAISGALSGLAGITPGSGFVPPEMAFWIGIVTGIVSFYIGRYLNKTNRVDDALDVTSLQAAPGITGSILVGLAARGDIYGLEDLDFEGLFYGGNGELLGWQILATFISVAWSAFWTYIILIVLDKTLGINISPDEEESGIDIIEHGERAYDFVYEDLLGERTQAELSVALCDAATAGDCEAVQKLLNKGAKASHQDYDGRTPVHLAASHGQYEVLELLLKQPDVDVNVTDRFGGTPLEDAVDSDMDHVVPLLLNSGAVIPEHRLAPRFFAAAAKGDVALLERYINIGADVDMVDYDQRTALHVAAAESQEKVVRSLIEVGANANARDRWGQTPLEEAKRRGRESKIIRILDGAAKSGKKGSREQMRRNMEEWQSDTRSTTTEFGARMDVATRELVQAAFEGDIEEVRRLLKKGADPTKSDYDGRTPLHVAAAGGHVAVTKLLLSISSVNVNAMDRWHNTPLKEAHNDEIRNLLRAHGAITIDQNLGYELCLAAANGHLNELKHLVEKGADPNCGDYDSRTALHLAASKGHMTIVKYICELGVDLSVTDRYGNTAADDAHREGHDDIYQFIMKSRASREPV